KNNWIAAGALALAFVVPSALAAVSVQEADKLKSTLTPLGGERAGNGSDIPPWRGGLSLPPAGYSKAGQPHVDPFSNCTPLLVIAGADTAQYSRYLAEGQKGLCRTEPSTLAMPVYPTRRTAAAPEWVYENTYKNASRAELTKDGNG